LCTALDEQVTSCTLQIALNIAVRYTIYLQYPIIILASDPYPRIEIKDVTQQSTEENSWTQQR